MCRLQGPAIHHFHTALHYFSARRNANNSSKIRSEEAYRDVELDATQRRGIAGETLTLTSALAAVFSLATCVKVQPSLRQQIAEDPRLPLLEAPFTLEGLHKLAVPDFVHLKNLLWGVCHLSARSQMNGH